MTKQPSKPELLEKVAKIAVELTPFDPAFRSLTLIHAFAAHIVSDFPPSERAYVVKRLAKALPKAIKDYEALHRLMEQAMPSTGVVRKQ